MKTINLANIHFHFRSQPTGGKWLYPVDHLSFLSLLVIHGNNFRGNNAEQQRTLSTTNNKACRQWTSVSDWRYCVHTLMFGSCPLLPFDSLLSWPSAMNGGNHSPRFMCLLLISMQSLSRGQLCWQAIKWACYSRYQWQFSCSAANQTEHPRNALEKNTIRDTLEADTVLVVL